MIELKLDIFLRMELIFASFLMIMYKQIKFVTIPKTIAQSLAVYLFHIKYF